MSKDIGSPNLQYEAAREKGRWDLLEDLLGGTKVMQMAGTRWLPKNEHEDHASYHDRLTRSVLYPAYSGAVDRLSGKPFAKPINIVGEAALSDELSALITDSDMEGQDLVNFAHHAFRSAVVYGAVHILVDYPRVGNELTLQEERELGIRPFFEMVEAPQLIDWDTERTVPGGPPELAMIKIKDTIFTRDEDNKQVEVQRLRIYTREVVQVWYQVEVGEWEMVDEASHTFGAVPLVTCYLKQDGYLTAQPPLLALGELNLAHWQSYSDQRNILRWARMPILFGKMLDREEIVIAPNTATLSDNADGALEYVEHSGKAIKVGQEDLDELEKKLEWLGLEPETTRTGVPTATARAIDESRAKSDLQAWIREMEAAITVAFKEAGGWLGEELPEDFKVRIFSEFSLTLRSKDDLDVLNAARAGGDLDRETYLKEVVRRGVLSEDTIVEEVIQRLEQGETPQGDE